MSPVQDQLVSRLVRQQRLSWLSEFIDHQYDLSRFQPLNPLLAWRNVARRQTKLHTIEAECVFRELAAWRERIAVKSNMAAPAVREETMHTSCMIYLIRSVIAF
jgi:ribonuclease D